MEEKDQKNKKFILKALVFTLELFFIFLFIYLVFLPFYPEVKYKLNFNQNLNTEESKKIEKVEEKTIDIINSLPKSEYKTSQDRLIITKIGVNAPIVQTNNEEYGLSMGAWLIPNSSTPDKEGNTIITGHRFKYLPPSNLTFYLFHKLEEGDIVSVLWKNDTYFYKIREIKIVENTDLSILKPSKEPILTMFTCHPIYSTKNRLVIVADLIKK